MSGGGGRILSSAEGERRAEGAEWRENIRIERRGREEAEEEEEEEKEEEARCCFQRNIQIFTDRESDRL